MIPLHYEQDKEKEERYLREIKKGRNRAYLKDINDKCMRHLGLSFDAVVLLPPDELMKKQEEYDKKSEKNREKIRKKFRSIIKTENHYIENTLYGNMPSAARKIVFDTAKVKTCPYCNRNFIQLVEADGKNEANDVKKEKKKQYKSFFELDHFLDKDSYPMFAVSLYNLIPVCPSCNRVKSTQKFDYYPYRFTNRSDDLKFHYIIKGVDFLKDESLVEIDLEYRNPEIVKSVDGLYLKNLYESHKDLVQEIAGKVRFFGEDYLKSVCRQFPELFSNEEEAYRILYGNYYEAVDFPKRPLAKFTRDIYEDSPGSIGLVHRSY